MTRIKRIHADLFFVAAEIQMYLTPEFLIRAHLHNPRYPRSVFLFGAQRQSLNDRITGLQEHIRGRSNPGEPKTFITKEYNHASF